MIDIGPKKLKSLATIKIRGAFNETVIYQINEEQFLLHVIGVNFSFKIHMTRSTLTKFFYDYSHFMTEYDINRIKKVLED